MSEDTVKADPLFVGLTRPPLLFGVSYNYFLLNILISAVIFINSSSFIIVPVAVVTHLVGYVLCYKEPLIMELLIIKLQNFNQCNNRLFHGANSYDPY